MASLLFHIIIEVNIDISTIICILILSLISLFVESIVIVEKCGSIGNEVDSRSKNFIKNCDYFNVEDEIGFIPGESYALTSKY